MKYFIIPIMVLSFLLTACQEDFQEQSVFPVSENAVSFHPGFPETRGDPVMQLSELEEFKVMAYQHAGLWRELSASNPPVVFMDHISVIQSADNIWSYSPLKYWPQNGNLTFFGYAPGASVNATPNASGLSVSTPLDGQPPVITYIVPSAVENQPDLLVSTSSNYDLNRSANGNNAINMQLSHALACIGFRATGNGESISGIKISGVVGKGSILLGQPSIVWNIDPADTVYTFETNLNGKPLDDIPSSVLSDDGFLMMLPQALSVNAKLTVTIDDGTAPYEQTFSLRIPGYEEWKAGQFVEYQLTVLPTGAIILNPESLVLPFQEKSYSSFFVICPDQNPNAAWTVNCPDGAWLQICDNPSGVNTVTQSSPYTYSGNGTTQLFAFAPAANISGAPLVSLVTLEGTPQQVAVEQLYQDEIYVPKYPHDGWAGSNIYWVEDPGYPAGGYLTFDDNGETTHEQYQGVYFMWGSLVALSPMGNKWTGGLWNNGGGQILYIPNPDPATNGGWNPLLNSGWKYIPRLGWTNPFNPNGGGSPVDIPFNNQQSYLIQNHSPSGNVGDICKYITDMGWAPGAKEGRKWRMPTHVEYEQMTDYTREGAPFGVQFSDNPYGQMLYAKGFRREKGNGTPFFPNSGYRIDYNFIPDGGIETEENYRPGEAFSYWTSSPRTIKGDAFDFIGINGQPTNTQGFLRNSGATIRCVMERNN